MPTTPLEIRGDVDRRAVEQLARCAEAGDAVRAALLADGHAGYSQPIGGVIAYPEHLSVHHNHIAREDVDGVDCWVVRKGCTPAYPGQEGFVGATMGDTSVILEG